MTDEMTIVKSIAFGVANIMKYSLVYFILFQLVLSILTTNQLVRGFAEQTPAPRKYVSKSRPSSQPHDSFRPHRVSSGNRNSEYRSNSNNQERQSFDSNRNKFDFDNGLNKDKDQKDWKSGSVFNQQRKQLRQDPWWMRDEERNNPRILKPYRPWWRADPTVLQVSSAMKIAQLREEATRRGIHSEHMKKGEILMALKDLVEKYSLSDSNFRNPTYTDVDIRSERPSCYPESYEGSDEAIALLRAKIGQVLPAPSGPTKRTS